MTINPSVEAKTVPEFVAYVGAAGARASAIAPYQMSVCTKSLTTMTTSGDPAASVNLPACEVLAKSWRLRGAGQLV
jgi:hypothetical protein